MVDRYHLVAELDVLLLLPERPGRIITSGGDLDNRLKTLLDALRMPQVAGERTEFGRATTGTNPTYVLLEDDRLVSSISLRTDRLLDAADSAHVELVIGAAVAAYSPSYGSLGVFSIARRAPLVHHASEINWGWPSPHVPEFARSPSRNRLDDPPQPPGQWES